MPNPVPHIAKRRPIATAVVARRTRRNSMVQLTIALFGFLVELMEQPQGRGSAAIPRGIFPPKRHLQEHRQGFSRDFTACPTSCS